MKTKELIKKYKFQIMIVCAIVVIVIALIVIFGKQKNNKLEKIDKTESVSKVYQLIAPEYKDIDCVGECDYFYAFKGEGTTGKYDFFDETGKKIGGLDLSKIDPKVVATIDIEDITRNYFIISYIKPDEFDTGYVVYSINGKVLSEVDNADVLTDNYIEVSKDDKKYILDSKGKTVFEDVSNVNSYNNEFITFNINDIDKIIDNKGNEILSGYTIAKVVLNENDEVDYLIVKSSEDSIYNYYDLKNKTKKGDAFTSFKTSDDEIIITKKVDSKNQQFVLNSNGEQIKYEEQKDEDDDTDYYDEIKEKIDIEKYGVFTSVLNSGNQNYILVNSNSENKFGILDIEKNEFKELSVYKENSRRRLTLKKLSNTEGNNDLIYSIECSTYYCDKNMQFIYNFTTNELLTSKDGSKESLIYSYKLYENGYSVVETNNSSFDDSDKFFVYDSDGQELVSSDYDINIIDSKVVYYSSSLKTTGKINLYSLNENKIINLDDDEIINISSEEFEDKKLYEFVLNNKTYLINENGDIKELEGELKESDDVGLYLLNDDEIIYYNVFNEKVSSYKLEKNESINGSSGSEMVPYRNAIFVNNSYDHTMKVIGSDNKILLEKKNLQIYGLEKLDDGSILIAVKDNSDNLGVYIAR